MLAKARQIESSNRTDKNFRFERVKRR